MYVWGTQRCGHARVSIRALRPHSRGSVDARRRQREGRRGNSLTPGQCPRGCRAGAGEELRRESRSESTCSAFTREGPLTDLKGPVHCPASATPAWVSCWLPGSQAPSLCLVLGLDPVSAGPVHPSVLRGDPDGGAGRWDGQGRAGQGRGRKGVGSLREDPQLEISDWRPPTPPRPEYPRDRGQQRGHPDAAPGVGLGLRTRRGRGQGSTGQRPRGPASTPSSPLALFGEGAATVGRWVGYRLGPDPDEDRDPDGKDDRATPARTPVSSMVDSRDPPSPDLRT